MGVNKCRLCRMVVHPMEQVFMRLQDQSVAHEKCLALVGVETLNRRIEAFEADRQARLKTTSGVAA